MTSLTAVFTLVLKANGESIRKMWGIYEESVLRNVVWCKSLHTLYAIIISNKNDECVFKECFNRDVKECQSNINVNFKKTFDFIFQFYRLAADITEK